MNVITTTALFEEVLKIFHQVSIENATRNASFGRDERDSSSLATDTISAERLKELFRDSLVDLETVSEAPAPSFVDLHYALSALAISLDFALQLRLENASRILSLLADTSRQVAWRKPFGTPFVKASQASPNIPDCVLEVALRILSRESNSNSEDLINALRLIANCCADQDENQKVVVQRNGIKRMLGLVSLRKYADYVLPAIYNICIDFESNDPVDRSEEERLQSSQRLINAAEEQLAEACDASNQTTIVALLGLFDSVQPDRIDILADLVEMASRPEIQSAVTDIVYALVVFPGPRIASWSSECCVPICGAVINILRQTEAKQAVLQYLDNLTRLPFTNSVEDPLGEDADPESIQNLTECRKAFLKLVYEITSMGEFHEILKLNSVQIQRFVGSLRGVDPYTEDPDRAYYGRIPLSSSCVVLANLTTTIQTAEAFVQQHKIHQNLIHILSHEADTDVLLPALNFLIKLSLSDSNKAMMVAEGVFGPIQRLLGMDEALDIQRETVALVRLLIKGRPEYLTMIGEQAEPAKASITSSIFDLFRRTRDGSTKLEIGRLTIELCRTLFKSTTPEDAEPALTAALGPTNDDAADPVAFVAQHSQTPDAKAEGWFGLAMLSVWARGRTLVLNALAKNDMTQEVAQVAALPDGPSHQNLRLMLAKMHLVPKESGRPEMRTQLEAAAATAGLGAIWN